MNNPIKLTMNLNEEASSGNFQKIEKLFEKNKFTQKEIDEAFRECISHFQKNKNESYVNCINLFLKKTQEINYRNSKYNNTTILMFSIDKGNDAATDLIISCSKDDLDMNLQDNNGENTLFHLVNNNIFSTETKIDFIKDLNLTDYNIKNKNRNEETLMDILKDRNDSKIILEEIENKIKENKFDQNKLTILYNKKEYKELLELIENYERNDKHNIINSYSIKFNKLKMIINLYNINSKNMQNQPVLIIIQNKTINDIICQILDILNQVIFDEGGGKKNTIFNYSLCLILNKMIMYYQLDNYNDFIAFNNKINKMDSAFFTNNLLFIFYKYLINIDMMIQRGLYTKAKSEFNNLNNIINNDTNISTNFEICLNDNNKQNIIFPIDLNFDLKNKNNLLSLYKIFISIFFPDKNNNNNKKYQSLIEDLRNLKIEEKEGGKEKENEKNNYSLVNNSSNNNLKSFQKYLYLRLNYLNYATNKTNLKIPYKLNDNSFKLNIDGNKAENEFNKIYYYNYLGIISLKNGNYNIASYFFLKCKQIILQNTSTQLIKRNHFYPTVLFNLALSFFYSKKYKNTIKNLYLLLNYSNNKSKFFINYKYIYYRLGLSNLELLLSENKNANLLYKSFINNKFILKTPQKSSINEKIDIIDYFKKTFLLIKNNPNDPIYFSTLINLVFCCILKENYSEAIFYLKLNKSKESTHLNIIRNYLVQCYIYLNKIKLAEKILNDFFNQEKYFKDLNSNLLFYERLNSQLVTSKGFKLSKSLNNLRICAANKNYEGMHICMISILDSIRVNISFDEKEQGKIEPKEELPSYIINVFVYYYLLINRKDLALNILKKRTIKEILVSTNFK